MLVKVDFPICQVFLSVHGAKQPVHVVIVVSLQSKDELTDHLTCKMNSLCFEAGCVPHHDIKIIMLISVYDLQQDKRLGAKEQHWPTDHRFTSCVFAY